MKIDIALLNRRHEVELRIPIMGVRQLLQSALGSLTGNLIKQVQINPIEAFRSNICGYGADTPVNYPVCPLYGKVCKGPNNNGAAKIQISEFKSDQAHCSDLLPMSKLMAIEDDVYRDNVRRRG